MNDLINKKHSFKYLKMMLKIFSKIIYSLGLLSLSLLIVIFIYYNNSGIKENFPPKKFFKKIDNIIIDRYLGFSFFEIDDYFLIKIRSLKYLFVKNDLETIEIQIDQKNLSKLEKERQEKIKNKFYNFNKFSNATIKTDQAKVNIKLRPKGDRSIHWINKKNSSYKIDIRGDDRLWGLEEFSVQKPITRNYIHEFIFHKLLDFNILISLKYFFINLKINNTKKGIFAVEEGFSKELIERNKKRNGPIFGLLEEEGVVYPKIFYEIYSKNYWINNNPKLVEAAYAKLNLLKDNRIEIDQIFDLDAWAKFFAVIDYSNALHGSISKSVKLYYNPTSGKFEPIGFDGHFYELNPANNFILLDFLDPTKTNCNHICYDREWYYRFLKNKNGDPNTKFINKYVDQLQIISSKNFLANFKKKHLKEINFFNKQLQTEVSPKDRALYKGLGFFIFDQNYLDKRSEFISNRLKNIINQKKFRTNLEKNEITFFNNKLNSIKKLKQICDNGIIENVYIYNNLKIKNKKNCELFFNDKKIQIVKNISLGQDLELNKYIDITNLPQVNFKNNLYYLNKDLIIDQNTFLPKNKNLIINQGVKISIRNESIFNSLGSVNFNGTVQNPIKIDGNNSGSIILRDNKYKIFNTMINNLDSPKLKDKILYGGINIISSDLEIENLNIINSQSEDAINIISSNSKIKNLNLKNSISDGVDIDFGNVVFKNISCSNIKNDCFDVSGANIKGEYLYAKNSNDKGISFGENSLGEINKVKLEKNYLGIAVKDGSRLLINDSFFSNNEFDVTVFKKKNEYGSAKLEINHEEINNLNILVGINNEFILNNQNYDNKLSNDYIYNLFY